MKIGQSLAHHHKATTFALSMPRTMQKLTDCLKDGLASSQFTTGKGIFSAWRSDSVASVLCNNNMVLHVHVMH